MKLKILPYELTVCKLHAAAEIDLRHEFYFIAKTEEELSLVCKTQEVPAVTTAREDGWRAFYIQGMLDFSLIGILSDLSGRLAENKIGIFAVSTFNTDYILVKKEQFAKAIAVLKAAGYEII
ncbi:MAG: ACT domain-containing protein [Clostridiales bacterium]|nr:ACT domain-containing protein [Clostridiales bacterium]